MNKIIII